MSITAEEISLGDEVTVKDDYGRGQLLTGVVTDVCEFTQEVVYRLNNGVEKWCKVNQIVVLSK